MTPLAPPEKLKAAFAKVLRAAAKLPGIEVGTAWGTPALRVKGKFLVCVRRDGETLALRTDFDSRDAMLTLEPDIFYITDHFRDYPGVIVRLSAVRQGKLREILTDAWHLVAPKSLVARHAVAVAPRKRKKPASPRKRTR
ncbi:MAG TPA: MmcQ/YjbR family DNA-binding protein [Gemmatimonadales bacterium]